MPGKPITSGGVLLLLLSTVLSKLVPYSPFKNAIPFAATGADVDVVVVDDVADVVTGAGVVVAVITDDGPEANADDCSSTVVVVDVAVFGSAVVVAAGGNKNDLLANLGCKFKVAEYAN